jgi:hypothetical protein
MKRNLIGVALGLVLVLPAYAGPAEIINPWAPVMYADPSNGVQYLISPQDAETVTRICNADVDCLHSMLPFVAEHPPTSRSHAPRSPAYHRSSL